MLSIIICTYNRSSDLKEAIESVLLNTTVDEDEIIVVDNNSNDDTKSVVEEIQARTKLVKYVFEENPGLTYARNRGIKESTHEWLVYLDHDGVFPNGFIERIKFGIHNFDFKAWSGFDEPIYPDGKPQWIKPTYLSVKLPFREPKHLNHTAYFFSGGSMVISRSLTEIIGGFNESIGTRPGALRYGEETEYQLRLREHDIPTGYDPGLKWYHKMSQEKTNMSFILKQAYIKGYDKIANSGETVNIKYTLMLICFFIIINTPMRVIKSTIWGNYKLETALLDSIRKPVGKYGEIKATLDLKFKTGSIWN